MHAHSVVSDSATPWAVARQALLSMEFFKQEYWSGLPFPTPGDLPHLGIELLSPTLADKFFNLVSLEKFLDPLKAMGDVCDMCGK